MRIRIIPPRSSAGFYIWHRDLSDTDAGKCQYKCSAADKRYGGHNGHLEKGKSNTHCRASMLVAMAIIKSSFTFRWSVASTVSSSSFQEPPGSYCLR